jgi:hypothetical protein
MGAALSSRPLNGRRIKRRRQGGDKEEETRKMPRRESLRELAEFHVAWLVTIRCLELGVSLSLASCIPWTPQNVSLTAAMAAPVMDEAALKVVKNNVVGNRSAKAALARDTDLLQTCARAFALERAASNADQDHRVCERPAYAERDRHGSGGWRAPYCHAR